MKWRWSSSNWFIRFPFSQKATLALAGTFWNGIKIYKVLIYGEILINLETYANKKGPTFQNVNIKNYFWK